MTSLLLYLLFFELRQQWEDQNGYLNPIALIEKIEQTDVKELKSIKIRMLGGSITRHSEGIEKVIVETKNDGTWYTHADTQFMFVHFLHKLEKIGDEKGKLITYLNNKQYFQTKPFSIVLNPLLGILSSVSSVWWMIYLYRTRAFNKKDNNFAITNKQKQITFKDVAGNEEEKAELVEMVDFLKQPQKYHNMGSQIPKGVLLSGPPGTGKTLLAKALAGEAGVPFYSVAGSEFVEVYVGVGASRIRELFKEVRKNAPCVLFIDEIEVLGGQRGGHSFNSEKDQTLNQLLTEMDGFNPSAGIIIVAATNRSDMLDAALLRPGRFDRRIMVTLPDVKAREAILKLHAQNKKLVKDIDFHQLAKQTPGMSGAELAAVLNEASILTVRNNEKLITMDTLQEAIDRVWMGPAKKSRKYTEEERKETAYHEAGHAVIGLKVKDAPAIQKITIVPRGQAGGYVLFMEEKELFFHSKKRFQANIVCSLAGRAAEEMIFGLDNISDGCFSDFQSATRVARAMVTKYGMSDLGLMQDSPFADKKAINDAMKKIIDNCYQIAQDVLKENQDLLHKIANLLLEKETIIKEEIDKLV
ncbi:ATP-dependent zinc metalloprotease FtsH [Candidatus Phytoplasma meliae]|uniref:ATP-dependent zinc metalloprotease FtsH n=2 Tax=Candidatus Phytoplasma meliae TaxID=1848402 RepID=A0ABS5CZ64_9MOLU|nr:ATP-dependent zinc metalloprotease FtsH [Candidatus Phytoplasma meliae]MBP5836276.1 ATP-dependent zinc metalloprotease FtsH [Candidatus Phytoplasma meliae]